MLEQNAGLVGVSLNFSAAGPAAYAPTDLRHRNKDDNETFATAGGEL